MRKPCCEKQGTNKGAWSKQEDEKLVDYIRTHGEGCWRSLPVSAGLLRCGKSCRLRWINYLRPDLKRGNFGEDEEDLIIKLHALLGNRWSLIAGRLPGRTDNEVKNYWNSHLKRKLIEKGIDPNNHRLIHINTPRPQSHSTSASATTSASNSRASQTIRSKGGNNHISKVDGGSYLEEENTVSQLPDLNLDLTIKFPSPSICDKEEDETKHKDHSAGFSELDCAPSPTLLLLQ